MPTYEYACTNPECGHTLSAVQAFTEDSLTECPVCGGRLRKVFGTVGVMFKGWLLPERQPPGGKEVGRAKRQVGG